jgi:hypothetical protein
MFGRETKKQLIQALESLSVSTDMAKRFSDCLDETQSLIAMMTPLLDEAQARAEEWRRRYEDSQNRPGAVNVCDNTPAVNGWVN